MRLLQAYCKSPAFTGMDVERFFPCTIVTCKQDVWRNNGTGGEHLFHIEDKTKSAFMLYRKFSHHTDDLNIFALPFGRQGIGQTLLRKKCSVEKTKGTGKCRKKNRGCFTLHKSVTR